MENAIRIKPLIYNLSENKREGYQHLLGDTINVSAT